MRIAVYGPDTFGPGAPVEGDVVVVAPRPATSPEPQHLDELRAFARAGGRLLALGEGVAWLCAAELLPGAVRGAEPEDPATHVRVEGRATPFTWAIPAGRVVPLASAPPAPRYVARYAPRYVVRYVAPDADVLALGASGRVVLRYCDGAGGVVTSDRAAGVAGLCDETGHVVGVLGGLTESLDGPLGRQIVACLARA